MQLKIKYVLPLLWMFSLSACYYGNEEDLFPTSSCVTENVSFQQHIQPILQNRCLVCHSAGANLGNVTLEGYNNLKVYVDNQRLLGAVRHESGFSPMPQDSRKLSDCEISQIESWVGAGAQNN